MSKVFGNELDLRDKQVINETIADIRETIDIIEGVIELDMDSVDVGEQLRKIRVSINHSLRWLNSNH